MFQIQHPSSILYLGVFDYDEGPLEQHDPIGRVVIHIDTFEENTVYTLKYPLYEDSEEDGVSYSCRCFWKVQIVDTCHF